MLTYCTRCKFKNWVRISSASVLMHQLIKDSMLCQHPYIINKKMQLYLMVTERSLLCRIPAHSRLTVENIMHPHHNNMEYSPAGTGEGGFLSKVSRK